MGLLDGFLIALRTFTLRLDGVLELYGGKVNVVLRKTMLSQTSVIHFPHMKQFLNEMSLNPPLG